MRRWLGVACLLGAWLAGAGCSPECRGRPAALFEASRVGDSAVVRKLLSEGVPANTACWIRSGSRLGSTMSAFHAGVDSGRWPAVQAYLEHGMSADEALDRNLRTAGDPSLARELLARGARPTPTHSPQYLESALTRVERQELHERVALLREVRVDADVPRSGQTLLAQRLVAQPEDVDAIKALLELGADANKPNPEGLTPLELAIRFGTPATVRALVGFGADPARPAADGREPWELTDDPGLARWLKCCASDPCRCRSFRPSPACPRALPSCDEAAPAAR